MTETKNDNDGEHKYEDSFSYVCRVKLQIRFYQLMLNDNCKFSRTKHKQIQSSIILRNRQSEKMRYASFQRRQKGACAPQFWGNAHSSFGPKIENIESQLLISFQFQGDFFSKIQSLNLQIWHENMFGYFCVKDSLKYSLLLMWANQHPFKRAVTTFNYENMYIWNEEEYSYVALVLNVCRVYLHACTSYHCRYKANSPVLNNQRRYPDLSFFLHLTLIVYTAYMSMRTLKNLFGRTSCIGWAH